MVSQLAIVMLFDLEHAVSHFLARHTKVTHQFAERHKVDLLAAPRML